MESHESSIRAIAYRRYGGPDCLEDLTIKPPIISARRLIVNVQAIGLNPLDYRLRRGEMNPVFFGDHRVIASDFAGVVCAVGPGVNGLKVGDKVYGMVNQVFSGAAQEKIIVRPHQVALRPHNISVEHAAAVPLAALTAFQALYDIGRIRKGHRVLINGASGGVGVFATQLAKKGQAWVTAVTSFRNTDWMPELGADEVIDYTKNDFVHGSEGYDIIFDCYGNRSFSEVGHRLRPGGVYISTIPSIRSYLPVLGNMFRRTRASVVVVRSKSQQLDTLRNLIETKSLRPIIDSIYDRKDIKAAYEHLETKRARGKIVVRL